MHIYPHLQDTHVFTQPADLTHIGYSPLQHLSRSYDDYMKIMTKRFNVMKKVVF